MPVAGRCNHALPKVNKLTLATTQGQQNELIDAYHDKHNGGSIQPNAISGPIV